MSKLKKKIKAAKKKVKKARRKLAKAQARLARLETRANLPPYAELKQEMKGQWDALKGFAANGQQPDEQLLTAFYRNAQLITQYRGKGDDHYAEFLARIVSLEQVTGSGDWEKYPEAVAAVGSRVKGCHDIYKK